MNTDGILTGRKGLIMGVANDHSIAWAIAKAAHAAGATLGFTYQGDSMLKRVKPLADSVGSTFLEPCDVGQPGDQARVFERVAEQWDNLDFVVHAIAFSDKSELKGRYVDTSSENFQRTMEVSCFSFTETARLASPLMKSGGSLLTLSFSGAERWMPSYNVMGVAKAALEASVRYLAVDLGAQSIRVNAISAGPMRTVSGAAVGDARYVFGYTRDHAPLMRAITQDDVGGAGLYLLSDLSSGVTGEVHHVDSGYNVMGMMNPHQLDKHADKPVKPE